MRYVGCVHHAKSPPDAVYKAAVMEVADVSVQNWSSQVSVGHGVHVVPEPM